MSKIRPILFNTDMVKAILENRKTVTRRLIKQEIKPNQEINLNGKGHFELYNTSPRCGIPQGIIFKPPYQPGDILYVRETWQYLYELDGSEQIIEGTGKYYYAATDTLPFNRYVDSEGVTHEKIPWKPSIHMPKAAARIWLKVTDVRVEQLKDITEEQAYKEGYMDDIEYALGHTAAWHFVEDFKNIYPDCTEDRWVWVIEFGQCEKPESEE